MQALAGLASKDDRLTGGWWAPGWIPFASGYGGAIVLLVDGSPGPAGQPGQVIAFIHDPDEMTWVAPSFGAYLQASAQALRATPRSLQELLDAL